MTSRRRVRSKGDSWSPWRVFRRLCTTLLPFWDKYLLIILLLIVQGTIHSLPILFLSKISIFVKSGQTAEYIRFGVCVLFPVLIFRWVIFDSILYTLVWVLGLKLSFRLRLNLYRHMDRLSMAFFQSRPIGEHMYRANADIDAVIPLLNSTMSGLPALFANLYQAAFMVFLVSSTGYPILLYLTLFLIPVYAVVYWMYTTVQRLDYQKRVRAQALTAVLRENIAGIRVTKAFDRVRFARARYFEAMVRFYKKSQAAYFMQWAADQIRVSPVHVVWPLSLPFFAYLGLTGRISVLTWGSVVIFSRAMLYHLDGIFGFLQRIRLYLIPARRLFETLDQKPEIEEPWDSQRLPDYRGEVCFRNVSYSYEKGYPVLQDISFRIPPGKKVAVVGPSGAGKSTIVLMLLRMAKPDRGQITIDGHDLMSLELSSVLDRTGVVLQDTFLFGGSVGDNIRYANPKISSQDVVAAAKAVGLHRDVMSWIHGYDTDVAEGSSLSGGQKQRVGLARAFIKKPRLLILDEVTSSLDPETEKTVLETLRCRFRNVSTLVVSHRISSVIDADEILVIDRGRIVQRGTHHALIRKRGLYRRLFEDAGRTGRFEGPTG